MDISYDRLISLLFAKADINKVPLGGSFELTPRCTLNCKMCYIHQQKLDKSAIVQERDTRFWVDLATQAKDAGTLLLLLTGGEPMLRADFDEIYTECKKLGFLTSVNTNATLIDDSKIRLFSKYPPQKLNITLYGTSKETYADLCGNADAYEKVINAIKELKKANVNIKLNYSIAPQNIDDTPAVQAFAKELDLPIQSVSYLFPPVRTCGETVRLPAAEAARAHFEWRRKQFGDKKFKEMLKLSQPESTGDVMNNEKINCRAGLSTYWVTWKGEMTPCGMMPSPNIPITDFGEAWKKICEEREKIFLPKECSTCPLRKSCDICAAVSLAETGKSNGVPPYACKKAHEYAKLCKEFVTRQ